MIEITALTSNIGAVVSGADLRAPLAPQAVDQLKQALRDHLVIFFRDQDLREDEQLAFAANFGPSVTASIDRRPGSTPMMFVTLEDNADSPPKADRWHTDVPFVATPPNYAFLSMQHAPPTGGDTLWASLYAVHDGLSPAMQALAASLTLDLGLGASAQAILDLYGEEYYNEVVVPFASVRQPLVRVHPDTGRRALYLCGSFMNGIVGMKPHESAALLRMLAAKLDDPNVQCRWKWRQHDLAVWDERCTNHRAMSDHYPAYRKVRRCLAGEEVPVPAPEYVPPAAT